MDWEIRQLLLNTYYDKLAFEIVDRVETDVLDDMRSAMEMNSDPMANYSTVTRQFHMQGNRTGIQPVCWAEGGSPFVMTPRINSNILQVVPSVAIVRFNLDNDLAEQLTDSVAASYSSSFESMLNQTLNWTINIKEGT